MAGKFSAKRNHLYTSGTSTPVFRKKVRALRSASSCRPCRKSKSTAAETASRALERVLCRVTRFASGSFPRPRVRPCRALEGIAAMQKLASAPLFNRFEKGGGRDQGPEHS